MPFADLHFLGHHVHSRIMSLRVASGPRNVARSLGSGLVLAAWIGAATWLAIARSGVGPADFLVYRSASQLAFNGGALYAGPIQGPDMPLGTLPFTYPPFAALALWPTTWFSASTAYILWSVLAIGVIAFSMDRVLPPSLRWRPWVVGGLTFLASLTSIVSEHVAFGQVNLPLMALVLADATRSRDSRLARLIPPGILIGVAAAIKLTPGLFIVFFLVSGQRRLARNAVLGAAGATVSAAVFLPANSWTFWTKALWDLNERVDFSGAGFASSGNNSMAGFLAAVGLSSQWVMILVDLIVVTAALVFARHAYRQRQNLDAVLIIGLTAPILSPISWIHHWVYLIPAIAVLALRAHTRLGRTGLVLLTLPLIGGPGLGERLLTILPGWLTPLAWIQRECLLIASIICVLVLVGVRHPAGDEETGDSPIEGSRRQRILRLQDRQRSGVSAGQPGSAGSV